jgi:hypothetical protein
MSDDERDLIKLFDIKASAYRKSLDEGKRLIRMEIRGDHQESIRYGGGFDGEELDEYREGLRTGLAAPVEITVDEWTRLIEAIERVMDCKADWRDHENLDDILCELTWCRRVETLDWQKRRFHAGDGPDPDDETSWDDWRLLKAAQIVSGDGFWSSSRVDTFAGAIRKLEAAIAKMKRDADWEVK